jgi:Tol biopolymer transport system component
VLISVATGNKRRLMPANDVGTETCPRFSPDGSMLAYVLGLRDSIEDLYVVPFRVDPRGEPVAGSPRRLTFDNRNIYGIAWARDGRSIIVASRRGGSQYQLWRIPVSGGGLLRLTATAYGDDIQPAISPKNNRLAYVIRFTDMNIWRAEIGGTAPAKPLIASTMYDTDPQYSPDGKRIAFRSDRSGNGAIWVADANGQGAVRVGDPGGPNVGPPRWSPDGRWLAFDSRLKTDTVICIASADGSAPLHRLPAPAGSNNLLPSWSHDGTYLYFGSRRTGRWELWKQPVFGDRAEQVTTQGGFDAFESADGKVVYYSKGPATSGIWRLPGEQLVFDSASAPLWGWIPGRSGIYYVDATPNQESAADLKYFDLATKTSRVIGRTSAKPALGGTSISVSPDERWIAYAEVDRAGSDIILVDGFR